MNHEQLILVDLEDNEMGSAEKLEAHQNGGLMHRAFSVFVHDGSRMLIQKRSLQKYHSGGLWANTCCSHPRVGETLETAIHRRLQEEAGFDCPLTEQFTFTYRAEFTNGLTEHEFDHVFLGEYAGDVDFDPAEASDHRWISFEDLKKEMVSEPQKFSSWFHIAAPKILKILTQ